MNEAKTSTSKTVARMAMMAAFLVAANTAYKELRKYHLRGKVILITGGSRGLGLILARQLAVKGARIAICARSVDSLVLAKEELERLGAEVLALETDVTDLFQVQKMIDDVICHYGKLDVLINNAGTMQVGPLDAMNIGDYEMAMDVHFRGPLYTILTALPHFKAQKGGVIVNTTSIGGKIATPHMLPYTASKFALVGLSEGMHTELKKHNIHVTTVVPFLMRIGSPRHITVKGDHEKEYAWFKTAAALPVFVQNPESAARSIVKAIEYRKTELVLSWPGKAATMLQGMAPGLVSRMMTAVNYFLPDNVSGGEAGKKGYESESELSIGPIASRADEAARHYNEF